VRAAATTTTTRVGAQLYDFAVIVIIDDRCFYTFAINHTLHATLHRSITLNHFFVVAYF